MLVAVGRRPDTDDLGLEHTRAARDPRGFVVVDAQRRTADPRVFAIGDVAGEPMLAHKAIAEGLVAAEAAAGHPGRVRAPGDPGGRVHGPRGRLVRADRGRGARPRGRGPGGEGARGPRRGAPSPWGGTDGLTKLVFEAATGRLLGVGLVGPHAGDLLAEGTLAVEMGAVAEDLAGTIHTHPTLSETLGEAAELFLGRPIHLPPPRA